MTESSTSSTSRALAVIPARYDSSRFPGKVLAEIQGKPMIQHVVERVRQAHAVEKVLVATDDERVAQAVAAFGGEAVMTRREHHSGTERSAEVASKIDAPIFVNVQGDEPLIEPAVIDLGIETLSSDPAVSLATLATPILQPNLLGDPNIVKVVMDFDSDALYFSRAPIPWLRDTSTETLRYFKHLGLYVFRREALLEFPTLPPGELERIEQLEQLRWLENGYRIRVAITDSDSIHVDVPEDVARVAARLSATG